MGKQSASKAHRAGAAERCPAPAVQQSIAVALALIDHDAQRRRDVALSIGTAATPPPRHHALRAALSPGAWREAPLGAALCHPCHPALAPRARLRRLLPRGHVGDASGRQALWPCRRDDRQRLPPVGLLRSGRLVPPEQPDRPARPHALGETTRQGQRLHRLRPYVGAGRVRQTETAHGVREAAMSARGEERRGGARRLPGRPGEAPQDGALS
jgi:hypothetical protein